MTPRHPVAFAILAVLAAAAFGILLRPLTPIDETRYLSVAWEMHQTGNWLVPSKNFAPYSDKPPLLFWSVALVWGLTGVSEFAGRMVVPVFAALAIRLCALLARRLWPEEDGIAGRAALALAGLLVFDLSAGLTMFDVPLTVAVLAGLICLADAGRAPFRFGPWAGFGAAIALGILTKGPVILFHLLPAALLLPLWSAQAMAWRLLPLRLASGLLVGSGLVALWLVPAILTGGAEYRDAILWHQSAGRLSESFAHARPWFFYLALLPLLAFPLGWSPGLWRAAHGIRPLSEAGLRLCLIWAGAALLLFSLTSGKQLHYLLPELPALALIAARLSRDHERFGLLPAAGALILMAAFALLAGTGLVSLPDPEGLLRPQGALIAWALLILALCWLALRLRGFAGAMLLSLGGLCAGNLLIATTGIGAAWNTREIADALAPRAAGGIAFPDAVYHAEFNFTARLTAAVATPSGPAAIGAWISDHPEGVILLRAGAGEWQPDPAWLPLGRFRLRNSEYGLWSVSDAPEQKGKPQ